MSSSNAAAAPLTREPIAHLLTTRALGRTLHVHAELDSTNDEAHRLAERGAPHGTVVIAEAQTKGRGRRGRVWTTPPGKALAMSILLRPELPASRAPELSFAAALAVCETARGLGAVQARLKWPNDVESRGRKLSGLLAELRTQGGAMHVVVGIGVNVNVEPSDLPPELRALATSLFIERNEARGAPASDATADEPVSRALCAARLLGSLEDWLDRHAQEGFAPLRAQWSAWSSTLGRRVRVEGSEPLAGVAESMDEDGALLVRTDAGELRRVLAGDVEHLRAEPAASPRSADAR